MAIIKYPLVQLLNNFNGMKPYLTLQTDMCIFEFVLIKNARYCQEPWMLAFSFWIHAWNVWWPKTAGKIYWKQKPINQCLSWRFQRIHVVMYIVVMYVLTTCFITSAHWAVPVQSLIFSRNGHFILTDFEKGNFVINDRSSSLRKSIRGNIWEGNHWSQSVCFCTNGSGESNHQSNVNFC